MSQISKLRDYRIKKFEDSISRISEALETIELYSKYEGAVTCTFLIDGLYSTWYFKSPQVANKAAKMLSERLRTSVTEIGRARLCSGEIKALLANKNVIWGDYLEGGI